MRKPAVPNPLHSLEVRQYWIISQTVLNRSPNLIFGVVFRIILQCVLGPTHGGPYLCVPTSLNATVR